MQKIYEILKNNQIILAVISNKRKSNDLPVKITVTPINLKNTLMYQLESFVGNQAVHKNISPDDVSDEVMKILPDYKNMSVFTEEADYQILIGKKGNTKITKSNPTKELNVKSHNNDKNYILKNGVVYDFLVELDIMTEDGRVKAQRYNKFVQINKYLEIISHSIEKLPKDKTINIIDFGCGKAYLTFALHYYLTKILNLEVKIIGVDLKQQVIADCNALAKKLGYNNIEFVNGDIKDFSAKDDIDIVISLHACDTATDEALIKAVKWNSKIIIAVPCCQHELFSKIKNEIFEPIHQYGILNDKLASIITDSLRGLALQINKYDVSIMEFTPLEHTAKNTLIRAEYSGRENTKALMQYKELTKFWSVKPYIDRIIM